MVNVPSEPSKKCSLSFRLMPAYQPPSLYQLWLLPSHAVPVELMVVVLRFFCRLDEEAASSALCNLFYGKPALALPAQSFDVATTKMLQMAEHMAEHGFTLACQLRRVDA